MHERATGAARSRRGRAEWRLPCLLHVVATVACAAPVTAGVDDPQSSLPQHVGCRWTGCALFNSGCDAGLETRESRSCGLFRGVNSMCCSRANEAAARWEKGARFAEEGNEDACFNRCPKNSRCNAKTKSCVCDIGYVMRGAECMSIKEGQDDVLPLPGEVFVEKKTAREREEDYEDPVKAAKRRNALTGKSRAAAAAARAGGGRGDGNGDGLSRRFG